MIRLDLRTLDPKHRHRMRHKNTKTCTLGHEESLPLFASGTKSVISIISLNPHANLRNRCCYYPYFVDEETEKFSILSKVTQLVLVPGSEPQQPSSGPHTVLPRGI